MVSENGDIDSHSSLGRGSTGGDTISLMAPSRRIGQLGGDVRHVSSAVGAVPLSHEYLFQKIPPVRAFARRIVSNVLFEAVVVVSIVCNVIAMALEDIPARRAGIYSRTNEIVTLIDRLTIAVFTLEFIVRVLAFGLIPLPGWCPSLLRPDAPITIQKSDINKVAPEPGTFVDAMQAAMDAQALVDTADLEQAQGRFYFKSNWNKLDFVVLVIGLLSVFVDSNKALSSLRSLRALRPLRMVQFIAPLQVILKSIWRAVGTLVDVFICLCFMYLLFALFGQQMYQGSLRRRCVAPAGPDALRFNTSSPEYDHLMAAIRQSGTSGPENYTVFQPETFCSFTSPGCDSLGFTAVAVDTSDGVQSVTVPFVCANINQNPRYGKVSFDHLGSSLWTVFMMTSLEGWTDVMYALMDAEVNAVAAIFSVSVIVVIAFLGIQLFTSALCTSSMQVRAEEAMNRRREEAIARAQKKLWQERQRLKRNVHIVATVWRQNARMRALRRLGIESSNGDSDYPHHMMSDASFMHSGVVRTIVEASPLGSCGEGPPKATPVHRLTTKPNILAVPLEPKTTLAGLPLDGSARMSRMIELPDTTRPQNNDLHDEDGSYSSGTESSTQDEAEDVGQLTRQRSGSLPPRLPSMSTSPKADSPVQSEDESDTIHGEAGVPLAAPTPETLVEPMSAIPRALLDDIPTKRHRPLLAPLELRKPAADSPLRTMSHVNIPLLKLSPAPPMPVSLTPQNLTSHRGPVEPLSARYKTSRVREDRSVPHPTARSGVSTSRRGSGTAPSTTRGRQTQRGLQVDASLSRRSSDQKSARSAATGTAATPKLKAKRTLGHILTGVSTKFRGSSEPPNLRSAAPMLKKLVKRGGLQRTTRMTKFSSRGLSRLKFTGSRGLSTNSFFERSNHSLTTPGSARRPSMDSTGHALALLSAFRRWKPVAAFGRWVERLSDAIDPLCGRCSRLLEKPWFDRTIVGCIIVNAIGIASFYHNLTKPHEMALQISEFIFAWIFTFEMLIKFFGLRGLKNYFSTKQNVFDFIVVVTSLPSIVIPLSAGSFSSKNKLAAVSSLRLFRLFRVFRIARLLHKLKSMRKLLTNVLESITAIANLLFFILFALVTLSIATTNLFSRKQAPVGVSPNSDFDAYGYNVYANGHSPRYHYDSFFDSFLSLFIIMTGENWTDWFYYSVLTANPIVASIFQLFYFVLSNYVLLSLFIAVIIRNFDAKEEERDRQQRTAYERLNELIRHKATMKVQRRRSSVTKAAKDLAKSFRIPKLRRTSAVAPEPIEDAVFRGRSESVTINSVSTAPVINQAQARQPFSQLPPPSEPPQQPPSQLNSVRTTSRPPVFLAMLRNVTTSVRDSMSRLVSHAEGVSDALLTDEHVLDEARKLGAAMDMTAANKEDHPRMEGVSLGRFSRKSPFRILCYFTVTHRYFEWMIMACIMASGVMLAIQAGQESGGKVNVSDMVFNAVFLIELLLKVVAFGWYRTGRFAYLKNSWNIADLVILVGSITASLVDMLSTGSSVKFLRVFRLGRALRPLRVIRGNASMRVVVSSLMSSFTDVLNVYLLSQVVSLMFAIVGVSLFSGLLLRCNNPAATGVHDCVGTFVDVTTGENTSAVWSNPSYGGLNDPPFSFDDILNAFLVVKEVQVTEGWTEVLSATVDITAEDQQPQFNASPMNSLYFVALLTIGTFFVAQLYTGVIVASYSRSDGTAFMTEQQRDWIVAKLTIVKNKPPVVGRNDTEWAPRRLVQDLLIPCKNSSGETCHRTHHHVHSQAETGVAIAVMLNMAVISCYHYGMSKELTTVLDHLNTGFLVLFAVEMALKLFALGFKRYWTDASNAFDGSIVVGSLAIMLLSLDPTFASLSYFTQIARLFRVGRLLRLTHHFPRLKKLFETIIYALPSMGNVTALLLLVLFVGTIIGMEMFGDVPVRDEGPGISRHANFRSFWSGFLLLFRGLTGENINVVARDCMRIHTLSPIYFMMFNDVVKSVFLNLYLATIIDKLDGAVNRKNRLFEEDFERFEAIWLQYDKKANGHIPVSLLRPFLRRLKKPLGGPEPPKEFTTWYLAVFPMIVCHAKKNRVRYRDVLMALTTHAVDAKHLLVGERVHRDVLLARSEKMLAALRIQCAYRSYRTRQMFDKIRDMTKSQATMRSLRKLQELAGLKRDPLMLTASGSNGKSTQSAPDSDSGSEVEI